MIFKLIQLKEIKKEKNIHSKIQRKITLTWIKILINLEISYQVVPAN